MKLKQHGANQTQVTLADGTVILFSYETPVAAWSKGAFYRTDQHFSRTTSKHITQWLTREGCAGANVRPQSFFDNLARGTA